MNQDKKEGLKACLEELVRLSDTSQIRDLEGIEKTVRSQILELVSPEIALFLWNKQPEGK
jgi:hypothetical protein